MKVSSNMSYNKPKNHMRKWPFSEENQLLSEGKEEKSTFFITDYIRCKLHFSHVYALSELQFDILWYKYLNEKTEGIFSSDEKQIYIVKGKNHVPLDKSGATILIKTIQKIKEFKKPLDFLKQDKTKFDNLIAGKLTSLY